MPADAGLVQAGLFAGGLLVSAILSVVSAARSYGRGSSLPGNGET